MLNARTDFNHLPVRRAEMIGLVVAFPSVLVLFVIVAVASVI